MRRKKSAHFGAKCDIIPVMKPVARINVERLRLLLASDIKRSRNMIIAAVIVVNSLFFMALQFAA